MNGQQATRYTLWKQLFSQKKTWLGLILLLIVLLILPIFFNYIENRKGFILNDIILEKIPAYEVSIPIFLLIWGATIFMLVRVIQLPQLFPLLLWTYVLLLITRVITLYFVPLNPPLHLIPLQDPLIKIFYGNKNIVNDLFYSGHTATLFMFYLCLKTKHDKRLVLLLTIFVAILLLVQHIHYSIDILFAPAFSILCYTLAKKINPTF